MKETHHETLALQTLAIIKNTPELTGKTEQALGVLYGNPDNLKWYANYASAPDRIRDVYLDTAFHFSDMYEFDGNNLSAFQHFLVADECDFRGYKWDHDGSLGMLETIGKAGMELTSTTVKYDTRAQAYGWGAQELADSPMARAVQDAKGTILSRFQFPSADVVASYYGDSLAPAYAQAGETTNWAKSVGFTLHFVMDSCCAHHNTGTLLDGHSAWEAELWKHWQTLVGHCTDTAKMDEKLKELAVEVQAYRKAKNLDHRTVKTVRDVVQVSGKFTQAWLNRGVNAKQAREGKISEDEARSVCIRALAFCSKALELMSTNLE